MSAVLTCSFPLGAILAFMLGIFQVPLEECEKMYRELGSDVFKQNVIVGTMKMGWSHAFYDSEMWENILKLVCNTLSWHFFFLTVCFFFLFLFFVFFFIFTVFAFFLSLSLRSSAFFVFVQFCVFFRERMGDGRMIESARNPHCPKVSV